MLSSLYINPKIFAIILTHTYITPNMINALNAYPINIPTPKNNPTNPNIINNNHNAANPPKIVNIIIPPKFHYFS